MIGSSARRLVRPHAEPEEAEPELVADRLALLEVARRLGAGLVEVLERRAGQLELAGGLEADGAVGSGQSDDLSAFLDRPPAELGQPEQQVADAAGLLPRGRAVIVAAIDELLVLGADAPVLARLFAAENTDSRSSRLSIGRSSGLSCRCAGSSVAPVAARHGRSQRFRAAQPCASERSSAAVLRPSSITSQLRRNAATVCLSGRSGRSGVWLSLTRVRSPCGSSRTSTRL